MKEKQINIIVGAGGTGGHLFPALAVLEQLKQLFDGEINAVFVGNPEKIEARTVPNLGYEFIPMPIRGFAGILNISTMTLPFRVVASILKCRKIIKKKSIDFALCTGAYISYPAGAAAFQEKKPLVLMESNVMPGKSIRLLSSRADLIITSFEESKQYYPHALSDKIKCLGNPVRQSILQDVDRDSSLEKFNLTKNKKTVLIFGGSLGARSINNTVSKMLLNNNFNDLQFIWQTGSSFESNEKFPENVKIYKFIDDMASAYAAADLVVSRSGATSIAEICVAGKASILIPLPSASNNEQLLNANTLVENDAAILIDDFVIEDNLERIIIETVYDNEAISSLSENAKRMAKPDAARNAALEILKLLKMD